MSLFAQFDLSDALLAAALAVIILPLLIRSYRYFSRRSGDNGAIVRTVRPPRNSPQQYHDQPAEAAQWQVAMHETARQLSAQLDSKMGALQELIAEADRAAARLEAAAKPSTPIGQAETIEPAIDTAESSTMEGSPLQDRCEQVYLLSDYGYDPAEIARRVGAAVGQVELVLSLRGP